MVAPVTLTPDPFAHALWQLYDTEREARRRPAAPAPGGGPTIDDDGVVVITDPDKYASSALDRAVDELALIPDGQRNHGLNNAAFGLGRLVGGDLLDYDDVVAVLDNASAVLWPDRDPHNCIGTIHSGLRGGLRDPLVWVKGERTLIEPAAPFLVPGGSHSAPPVAPVDRAGLLLAQEVATQRARREAKRLLDEEEQARLFRVPPSRLSLVDELAMPIEPITYAIDDLLPAGGNALLTAEYKAGKTSTVNDLVRSFCDGTPFLGRYTVNPAPGRIAVFNYEVGEEMYRGWLRDLGIVNPDRAAVLNLRGFRVPVTTPSVEDWVVQWLQEREVSFWIVDPFARAFTGCGDNENDNSQVGWFLDALDVIKARAGVRDLVLPTHTGRAEMEAGTERSRGATRLEDWCDVRWVLTKGEIPENGGQPPRFFRATGRGVEVEESMLAWNEEGRTLAHGGGDRKHVAERDLQQRVLDFLNSHPGASKRAVLDGVTGKDTRITSALSGLVNCGAVAVVKADKPGAADAYSARRATVVADGMAVAEGFPTGTEKAA